MRLHEWSKAMPGEWTFSWKQKFKDGRVKVIQTKNHDRAVIAAKTGKKVECSKS